MNKNKKLCTWYFAIVIACAALSCGVFLVMNKIERVTSRLESHIYRRDLSIIVDKDYKLELHEHSDQSVELLNELTDFFSTFHEHTVNYKLYLQDFMEKRNKLINRFNSSSVHVYDLSIVPNKRVDVYNLKEHVVALNQDPLKAMKQIPFSRELKFRAKDSKGFRSNMLFLCTARLSVSSTFSALMSINFVTTEDIATLDNFMEYRVAKTSTIVTLNRVVRMNNPKNFRIAIKGFTNKLVSLHKVEAYCVNFVDYKEKVEVSKTK